MDVLIQLVIWAAVLFLALQLGSSTDAAQHEQRNGTIQGNSNPQRIESPELRWIAPERATDPVCGREVATDKAKPSVHDGDVYYFCSRDCRELFETAPKIYLDNNNHRKLEHSHA